MKSWNNQLLKLWFLQATEASREFNSQDSKIFFGYVDFYAKSLLILYPSLENSTTPIAITYTQRELFFKN